MSKQISEKRPNYKGLASAELRRVRLQSAALLLGIITLSVIFSDRLEQTLANRLFDAYHTMVPRRGLLRRLVWPSMRPVSRPAAALAARS
ncbi:MAG: hypothetical protein L7F78_19295 [Syntrophales bacterium LBB04]|nr:hypothetical protein [Syntrophales bacterium LBB04]